MQSIELAQSYDLLLDISVFVDEYRRGVSVRIPFDAEVPFYLAEFDISEFARHFSPELDENVGFGIHPI